MCKEMEDLLKKGISIGENKGIERTLSGLADEMKAAGVTEEMVTRIIANYQAKNSADKEA